MLVSGILMCVVGHHVFLHLEQPLLLAAPEEGAHGVQVRGPAAAPGAPGDRSAVTGQPAVRMTEVEREDSGRGTQGKMVPRGGRTHRVDLGIGLMTREIWPI